MRAEYSNGNGSHAASQKQIGFIHQLARGIRGLGPRNLDQLTGRMFGKPLAVETTLEQPLIVDFKTAGRSAAPFEVTHEMQFSCYAYLYRQAAGQQEGDLEIRSLIKTKTPKLDFHSYQPRTEQHFRRLFAVIRAYLDDLDRGDFIFRPGIGCVMCDFRDDHCLQWRG